MQINPKNHNGHWIKDTLVYETPSEAPALTSAAEVKLPREEILKTAVEIEKKKLEEAQENLKKLTGEYTDKYEPLPALEKEAIDQKINGLEAEKEKAGTIRKIFFEIEGRREILNGINTTLINIELAKTALKNAEAELKTFESEALKRSEQNIVDRVSSIEKLKTEKPAMEKELYFREFSNVVETNLGDLSFQGLSRSPDGIPSATERRMHYQNFMSILRFETNNFSTLLVIPGMTSNWKQNKENFPQYYKAWLEEQNSELPQKISLKTSKITKLSKALGLSGIDTPTVDEAIKAILQQPSGGTELILPENTLLNVKTSTDEVVFHEERGSKINDMMRALKLENDKEGVNPQAKIAYQKKIKILADFIKLEDQIANLKRDERELDETIDKNFVKEKIEGDESIRTKFIRLAFDQYKQAVEIVNSMGILNPKIRLEAIATLYRQGVNKENAAEAHWMLAQLMQSERYNELERGQRTSAEQRDYLMIAYQSSQALHNWKNYEKETRLAAKRVISILNDGTVIGTPNETKTVKDWKEQLRTLEDEFVTLVKQLPEGRFYDDTPEGREQMLNIYLSTIEDDKIRERLIEIKKTTNVIQETLLAGALKESLKLNGAAAYQSIFDFPVREGANRQEAFIKLSLTTTEGKALLNNRALTNLDTAEKQKLIEIGQKERMKTLKTAYETQGLPETLKSPLENLYIYELNRLSAPIWAQFIEDSKAYLKKPETPEAQAFLRKVEGGETLEGKGITKTEMGEFKKYMNGISTNYDLMDFEENSKNKHLELIGIRTETIYANFVSYLEKNPEADLRTAHWDTLLRTKEGVAQLKGMFEAILPEQVAADSMISTKKDFIRVFSTLNGYESPATTTYEGHEAQAAALTIYNLIKLEINKRERAYDVTQNAQEIIRQQMEGVTIADRIEEYSKGVIDMVIGPGQNIGNRIAGIAILMFAWSAAKKAYKGEGPMGKSLRVLFMAGAAELTMKQITGRGILERVGLSPAVRAVEGTYDAVLIEKGKDFMNANNIPPDQHMKALYELKDVPFENVIKFYESTTEGGLTRPGMKDVFPAQIDVEKILSGSVSGSSEAKNLEGRRIIRKVLQQFFEYVGNKEGKHHEAGFSAVKERYIKGLDPAFRLAEAKDTEFAYNAFRDNPKMLTFDAVKTIEINTDDLPEGTGNKILEAAKEYYNRFRRFSYEDIYKPASKEAKEFYETAGNKAKDIKKWLNEMADKAATGLSFEKEKVVFWYQAKKHTIRRFAADHWELIVEGAKLPFAILYGMDKAIVPWVTTKIRQTSEILNPDKLHNINADLKATDIRDEQKVKDKKNTEAAYFGVYQEYFAKAFKDSNKYYQTVGKYTENGEEKNEGDIAIAYYITEANSGESGVRGIENSSQKMNALQIKSYEKAKEFFVTIKHVDPELVEKYLYPIHVMRKSETPGNPEKMYTFWRMPLTESGEFKAKEQGRWADYMDPNEHKFRPPFILDPSKTMYENIMDAYGLRNAEAREGYSWAASNVLAQAMRVYIKTAEKLGGAAATAIDFIPNVTAKDVEWIREISSWDESTKRKIDEVLTSAKDPSLAISDFYSKNNNNANEFKTRYEKAIEKKTSLDEKLEGWKARDARIAAENKGTVR